MEAKVINNDIYNINWNTGYEYSNVNFDSIMLNDV